MTKGFDKRATRSASNFINSFYLAEPQASLLEEIDHTTLSKWFNGRTWQKQKLLAPTNWRKLWTIGLGIFHDLESFHLRKNQAISLDKLAVLTKGGIASHIDLVIFKKGENKGTRSLSNHERQPNPTVVANLHNSSAQLARSNLTALKIKTRLSSVTRLVKKQWFAMFSVPYHPPECHQNHSYEASGPTGAPFPDEYSSSPEPVLISQRGKSSGWVIIMS